MSNDSKAQSSNLPCRHAGINRRMPLHRLTAARNAWQTARG
jgi:hypothetical protein